MKSRATSMVYDSEIKTIRLDKIEPNPNRADPRTGKVEYAPVVIEQLRKSMQTGKFKSKSVLLREKPGEPGKFQVVYGHHRLEAAKLEGIVKADFQVYDVSDDDMVSEMLHENAHDKLEGVDRRLYELSAVVRLLTAKLLMADYELKLDDTGQAQMKEYISKWSDRVGPTIVFISDKLGGEVTPHSFEAIKATGIGYKTVWSYLKNTGSPVPRAVAQQTMAIIAKDPELQQVLRERADAEFREWRDAFEQWCDEQDQIADEAARVADDAAERKAKLEEAAERKAKRDAETRARDEKAAKDLKAYIAALRKQPNIDAAAVKRFTSMRMAKIFADLCLAELTPGKQYVPRDEQMACVTKLFDTTTDDETPMPNALEIREFVLAWPEHERRRKETPAQRKARMLEETHAREEAARERMVESIPDAYKDALKGFFRGNMALTTLRDICDDHPSMRNAVLEDPNRYELAQALSGTIRLMREIGLSDGKPKAPELHLVVSKDEE